MKIAYICNVDSFFISHRLPLAKKALEDGNEVFVIGRDTGQTAEIKKLGIQFINIPFHRSGTNPFFELYCIIRLTFVLLAIRPDLLHLITIKAALLGGAAAKLCRLKAVVIAISGLGYSFTDNRNGFLQKIMRKFMYFSFKSKYFSFILQNPDDVAMFKAMNLVPEENIYLIKGSGVDLNEFHFYPLPEKEYMTVLFPARILRDKGIVELLQAAHNLQHDYIGKIKFVIAGNCDEFNPAVYHESELRENLVDNYIIWVGFQKEMINFYKNADIVVLPSYREGLPKSLIEACAIGRPIITTDAPGCRECVKNKENGFIVPVKDVSAIEQAIIELYKQPDLRRKMAQKSRILAEQEFSINMVVNSTFKIYRKMITQISK